MKDKLSLCIIADGLMLISPAVFIYGLCSRIGLRGGEGEGEVYITLHLLSLLARALGRSGGDWVLASRDRKRDNGLMGVL